jgi:hypothetical protein
MRSNSHLVSVSLDTKRHGDGITWARQRPTDSAFFTWAGPWAEARLRWGDRPLDERDDDDLGFADHLAGAFLEQVSDLDHYVEQAQEWDALVASSGFNAAELRRATEHTWSQELERVWPAILHVAELLLRDETVTHAIAFKAVEAAWGSPESW